MAKTQEDADRITDLAKFLHEAFGASIDWSDLPAGDYRNYRGVYPGRNHWLDQARMTLRHFGDTGQMNNPVSGC